MPRQGRLDAPGTVHHVMARGIARSVIFKDDRDRRHWLELMGALWPATKTSCLAWTLMPNHVHLLVRTGQKPLAWVMHRLLLRYALWFNHRWHRAGHLFQNRYKALHVDEDLYLTELVRYIHLNPYRARLVSSVPALVRYPWCGHGALLGNEGPTWQDTETVLAVFDTTRGRARTAYGNWIREGASRPVPAALKGGGLMRQLGEGAEQAMARRGGPRVAGDERIMGDGLCLAGRGVGDAGRRGGAHVPDHVGRRVRGGPEGPSGNRQAVVGSGCQVIRRRTNGT